MKASRRRRQGGVAILVYNIDAPGGMERQAGRLASAIARAGRPVVIVSTFFPERGRRPLVERREGVLVYRVPFLHGWNYPTSQELYETLAAWILHKHAGELDTIYAVQGHTGGVHAEKVSRVVALPVVLKLACSGEAGEFAWARRETPDGGAEIHRRLRRLDRVVWLNEESRAEALAAGIDASRLLHIPNGIELDRFDERVVPCPLPELAPAEGGEREVVLFLGRLARQKRIHVLIEACARLFARRPRARLAIAGEGPEREALERLARERGLAPGVAAFLGARPEVPELLAASCALVLPSAEEGLSNVLLEALAARVPVIASDIYGNRVVVRHEREGLLVPPDDPVALERALERLLEDRALAERLALAGRARVEEEFAIDRVAARHLALFDALPRRRSTAIAPFYARFLASDLRGFTSLFLRGLARTAFQAARMAVTGAVIVTKRALGLPVERRRS